MAAAAASAALVVPVAPEAQLPVPAERLVPASQEPELPALARLPVLAHLVVDSALLLDLLSRQSVPQPQWQGVPGNRGQQRTSRYRDQGGNRKAVRAAHPDGTGSRLVGDLELPGFTTAASGTPQDSLDALRKASATSYYKGQDSLWVKVVSTGDAGTGAPGGGTSVQISR